MDFSVELKPTQRSPEGMIMECTSSPHWMVIIGYHRLKVHELCVFCRSRRVAKSYGVKMYLVLLALRVISAIVASFPPRG